MSDFVQCDVKSAQPVTDDYNQANYLIELVIEGKPIKLLIPAEARHNWIFNSSEPIGLNLVTGGHYE